MSAESFVSHLPAVVSLDDLAAMNAVDRYGHRFELSAEGALSVVPPPDSDHAGIASELFAWLLTAGWPAKQILQAAGLRIPGQEQDGGRIPDLTLWAAPQSRAVWLGLSDLLLVAEIVSPGSAAIDQIVKVREYAAAGIPRYWLIDRDAAQTVTLHVLSSDHTYEVATKIPLAWLLQTSPADHGVGPDTR